MISREVADTAIGNPRYQRLCGKGMAEAKAFGEVNKAGRVRPGLAGRIRYMAKVAILNNASTDDFLSQVRENVCLTMFNRRWS